MKKTSKASPKTSKKIPVKAVATKAAKKVSKPALKLPAEPAKVDPQAITNTFLAAAALVIVIIFVAILASKGMNKNAGAPKQNVTSGQQTASITINKADGSIDNAMELSADSQPAGSTVKFKVDTFKLLALQPLKFNIYDQANQELTPDLLQSINEKKMRFILVSADLRSFKDLHPTYSNGVWNVTADMRQPGTYYAYVDFVSIKGWGGVFKSKFVVQKESGANLNYPGITPNGTAISGLEKALMKNDGLQSGRTVSLNFALTNLKDIAVKNLVPFLGAFGHAVILEQGNPSTYMNLSPATTTDEKNGNVAFMAMFKHSGVYTAFAEFSFGGTVKVFPITFQVQ